MPKIMPPCKVWQWDINDAVTVEGIENISEWQVHFATVGDTTALVIEIQQDMTAYIPNQLVELGTAIYAYLYNVREERAYTETAVLIPVNVRPKPSDYISEPTDVLTWGQLRADIGALSQLATEDKTNLVAAVNELHGDIETAYSEIDSIETTTTEQGQNITAIQSEVEKIEQSITDINNTDAAQSRQIAQNQQDIDELAQSDTQLAQSVSSLAQTVDKGFKQVQTELDKKQPVGDYITNAVDNLVNYYLKSETYTRSEVKDLIGSLTHINIKVVSSIDDVTEPNVIYLVPVSGGESDDYYNEYILVNSSPELIGNTRVDLSNYYTREQTDNLLNGKQPVGNYVTSVNGNVPDEGGNVEIDLQTYTAGEGINISDSGEIAVTNPMDDGQVSASTTWSSIQSVDSLSPRFEVSGDVVNCNPIEGSQLSVSGTGKLVWAGGKNIFDDSIVPETYTMAGVTITHDLATHTFTLNGTATGTINKKYYKDFVYALNRQFVVSVKKISGKIATNGAYAVAYFGANNVGGDRNVNNYINANLDLARNYGRTAVCTYKYINSFWFYITAGAVLDNYTVQVQLELGNESTPYEPYIGEPLDLQLPATVTAKQGKNILYADTGDITVKGYDTPYTIPYIVQQVSQPISESGSIITCYPVENSPLHVVSDITAVQEGTGDPSPDNVRPISGWDGARLNVGTYEYSKDFPETVYGGTLDWATGVLTVTWGTYIVTGQEELLDYGTTYVLNTGLPEYTGLSYGMIISNKIAEATWSNTNYNWFALVNSPTVFGVSNVDEAKSLFKSWYDTGVPLQCYYELKLPYSIQLTPTQILTISGLNTVYCDTGDVTVTGYEDPRHTVAQLSSRIAALESAATEI